MPQLRGHNRGRTVKTVNELQVGRLRPTVADSSAGPIVGCVGSATCDEPRDPDCPTPLCAKHLRETYEYAHQLVEQRWMPAVLSLME